MRSRAWIIVPLAIVAVAAGVLFAATTQRSLGQRQLEQAQATQQLAVYFNATQAAIGDFATLRSADPLNDVRNARARLDERMASVQRNARTRAEELAAAHLESAVARFAALVDAALAVPGGRNAMAAAAMRDAARRHVIFDAFHVSVDELARAQRARNDLESRNAALVPVAVALVLSILFAGVGAVVLVRLRRAARARGQLDRRRTATAELRRVRQARFTEALQVAADQLEAHGLLRAHLERTIPEASFVVLNRNNSRDRLEASTEVDEDSPIAEPLRNARPRSCMAVRLSRPFDSSSAEEAFSCELCSGMPKPTSCRPLLVGGEVIGSVLGTREAALDDDERGQIADSVSQAAPVLANLRNLAIAEMRAATDALTGLPNRRAIDENLLRMVAQASRTVTPLSAIMLDLDHFKRINDTFGHDRGDEVLATFGVLVRGEMRASDFIGRSGGEEFVALLPDTDRSGAFALAEKLRRAIHGMRIPGVEQRITASFGVATFPDDASEPQALMRVADRALYAAKRGGRDRVEASSGSLRPTLTGLRAS